MGNLMDLEGLVEQLQVALIEWPKGSFSYFFPIDVIGTLVNKQQVQLALRELFPALEGEELIRYVGLICSGATKIFAVFLYSSSRTRAQSIQSLIDEGISDIDLPFTRVNIPGMNGGPNIQGLAGHNPRYTLGRGDHDSCLLPNHVRCGIQALSKLPRMEIQSLCRDQWTVMSPVFERLSHHELADTIVLPFIEDHERDEGGIKEGGYSEVWAARIHRAHQTFVHSSDSSSPCVAIKRLYSRDPRDFHKERDMLRSLTLKNHPHLVKLLTTYTYKGRFHLLCPFAKANLRNYWMSEDPGRDRTTYWWVLKQIAGLASGLNVIHNFVTPYPLLSDFGEPTTSRSRPGMPIRTTVKPEEEKYGRHGDLKPENILCFDNEKDKDGILQIADLGLGRFHRFESRSKQDPKTINGSPTYVPPELGLERQVSRAYDIWSLGCIFLEFITWLLEGREGLAHFGRARVAVAHDGVEDDTFYMLFNTIEGRHGEVRKGVTIWMERLRHQHSRSEMVLKLLDVVQNHMLKINPEERIGAKDLDILMEEMLQNA